MEIQQSRLKALLGNSEICASRVKRNIDSLQYLIKEQLEVGSKKIILFQLTQETISKESQHSEQSNLGRSTFWPVKKALVCADV